MSHTCKNGGDCNDFRCPIHHKVDIARELANMNLAKKQLKRWCVYHRTSFYGRCVMCVQEAILDAINGVSPTRPPGLGEEE